jgi:hypothetical protein
MTITETPNQEKVILTCDASTYNMIEACYKKAEYSSIRNLEPREPQEPLETGGLYHDLLEAYYRALRLKFNKHPKYEHMERLEIINKCLLLGRVKAGNYHLDIEVENYIYSNFFDYCLYYGSDPQIPLAVELYFSKKMFENEELIILWEGKIDLFSYNPLNRVEQITDHKTTSRSWTPIPLDNQFYGYCYGLDCQNVIRNEIGLQSSYAPDKRYKRQVMTYPQACIDEWVNNTIYTLLDYYEHMKMGIFPRRFVSCKFCGFKEVCKAIPDAREWKEKMELKEKLVAWSPVTDATSQDADPFECLEGLDITNDLHA